MAMTDGSARFLPDSGGLIEIPEHRPSQFHFSLVCAPSFRQDQPSLSGIFFQFENALIEHFLILVIIRRRCSCLKFESEGLDTNHSGMIPIMMG
jgi:hypothetical protein